MKGILKNYREAFAGAERTVRLNARMVMLGLLLFGVNEVCLKKMVSWNWIHFYFNDLLAGVVFMAYCNLVFLPDDPRGAWNPQGDGADCRGRRILGVYNAPVSEPVGIGCTRFIGLLHWWASMSNGT